MRLATCLFALCAALSATAAVADDQSLPLVHEMVDEICIVRTVGNEYARVVFIRGESVLATRLLLDELIWTSNEDKFQLIWQDYSTAERIVEAEKFSVWVLDKDPTQAGQRGPWWCMWRNMRDLKQP